MSSSTTAWFCCFACSIRARTSCRLSNSAAKRFTISLKCVAIMALVEEGKIAISDPVKDGSSGDAEDLFDHVYAHDIFRVLA